MRWAMALPLLVIAASEGAAQNRPGLPANAADRMEQTTREWLLHATDDEVQRQIAERREADARRREFLRKAGRFVDAWNRFAHSYAETRTFNIKLAGEVEKAFREMKTDEGWLKLR